MTEANSEAKDNPESSIAGNDECVTVLFHELHWLPVGFWVQFKMLAITYKAVHGIQPGYLRAAILLMFSPVP